MAFEIEGRDVSRMEAEAGGHRIQRVPPTERRGRVHTSTVTVAVVDPEVRGDDVYERRSDADFEVIFFSGTGAGGQHRNRHMNSCRCIHLPTGIVETRQSREKASNVRDAKAAILVRLDEAARASAAGRTAARRADQVGSGMRGDKSVTIRFQDDRVQNHASGRDTSATRYMKGFMDEAW